MTDKQQLVKQVFNARFEQLRLNYVDELSAESEEQARRRRRHSITMGYYHRVGDLERAYFFDSRREYPLCLNPTLNLVPKLIRTQWGVLFA